MFSVLPPATVFCRSFLFLVLLIIGLTIVVDSQELQHPPDHDHEHDHDHDHGDHDHAADTKISSSSRNRTRRSTPGSEAYLYGTISVLIVSLLSLAGVIVLPFIKKKTAYNAVMLTFMALAVGTMTTDAVLHLIPETLGVHGHGESEGHVHEGEAGGEDKPFLGKLVALLGTLYALYLLEIFAHSISSFCKPKNSVRDLDNPNINDPVVKYRSGENGPSTNVEMWSTQTSGQQNSGHGQSGHGHSHVHTHSHGVPEVAGGSNGLICGLKSVAFVVTVSDALHNFTDGLAIGAAFAKSSASGLAVSIAVICHELPHEVGDFAILLNSGLSVKKALVLNFMSALTCFAGLYPGIAAGQQDGLRQWIFAAVAGGFLYVALVHMLREIKEFSGLPWYLSVTLQNIGLLVGFVVVLLLALYEDSLNALG